MHEISAVTMHFALNSFSILGIVSKKQTLEILYFLFKNHRCPQQHPLPYTGILDFNNTNLIWLIQNEWFS